MTLPYRLTFHLKVLWLTLLYLPKQHKRGYTLYETYKLCYLSVAFDELRKTLVHIMYRKRL